MKIRIRPTKVRMARLSSQAGVILALLLSSLSVMTAVAAFTMLCWKVGSDENALPAFPFVHSPLAQGFWQQRESWLLVAALAWLFAKLMSSFGEAPKVHYWHADMVSGESLQHLAVVPE